MVIKIITSGRKNIDIALSFGWKAGASYENCRTIRHLEEVYFIDINWKNYCYKTHLDKVKEFRPYYTVARDIENVNELSDILAQVEELNKYCEKVIIVPKDIKLIPYLEKKYFSKFVLGYSVPTKYGSTLIEPKYFIGPVHLLGGRPDVQRQLANYMNVVSIDGNRITLDAKYGDYFVGNKFIPHSIGGYYRCFEDSLINVNSLWVNYKTQIAQTKENSYEHIKEKMHV